MKNFVVGVMKILVGLSVFLSLPLSHAENRGSLARKHRCTLDAARMISLAEDGKACAEIVVGPKPYPVVEFAARELKTFLDQTTGADFKIVNAHAGETTAIFIGDCEQAKSMGVEAEKLPRDSFVIKSNGKNILIAGRDDKTKDPKKGIYLWGLLYERGTICGVYEFLERFAGTRFFFPGEYGTVTAKTPTLSVPGMDIYEEPDCIIRRVAIHPEETGKLAWYEEQSPQELLWTYTLINLRGRMQTLYAPTDHGLASRGYIRRFAKSHPEYFALRSDGTRSVSLSEKHSGHLCLSNEGLRNEIFEDAKSYLSGENARVRGVYDGGSDKYGWKISNHFPGYFDISPQDALGEGNWCHCEKCWPYWKENRQSDLVWGMVADIANRLKKANIPGNVTCIPYTCYRPLPNLEFPDNIYGSLCVTGPWGEVSPDFQRGNDKLIADWSRKLGGKLELRNYMNEYAGTIPKGVPPVSPHLVGSYWQKTAPKVNGAYTQANIAYGLFSQFPNAYVLYKCLWNSNLNVDELMKDSISKLFGPASKPMGRFFAKLEEIWTKSFAGYIIETPKGPTLARRTDREVWDEIYTPKVFAEFDVLFDEAEKLASGDADANKRVKFFRDKYLGEMKRVRNIYYNLKREIDDLVVELPHSKAAVVIDGKLDDAAWKTASSLYLTPLGGHDPLVKTEVRIMWTPETLYIGFDCEEPGINEINVADYKRDDRDLWQNASVEIFLNPSMDREKYFHFTVDARGIISDAKVDVKGGFSRSKIDLIWNSEVQVKTSLEKDRWIAEIAIPVKELKNGVVGNGEMWVANFNRSRHLRNASESENQYMSWSPFLTGNFHDIQRFGRIRFVEKIDDRHNSILLDGSFEGKISDKMLGAWYLPVKKEERELVKIDRNTYRDGCQSICISNEKAGRNDCISIGQCLPLLKPDAEYLLTFWVKAENIKNFSSKYSGAFVHIIWKGSDFNEFLPAIGYSGSFGWTKQAVKFKTPPIAKTDQTNAAKAWLDLRLQRASGKVWFDDVCIREFDKKE